MSSAAGVFGVAEPAVWGLGGEPAVAAGAMSSTIGACPPVGAAAQVDSAHGLSRPSAAVKRSVDLVGGAVLLLATLPIMALSALLIRLDGPGSVLSRQIRVGRGGEHFAILKFRTMIDGADALKAVVSREVRWPR